MQFIMVFVTASSKEEAEKISKSVVEQKLAACVNVLDGVKSIFRWKEGVDVAQECLLICKTKKSLFGELQQTIKQMHSYDVPEIIAINIVDGSEDYLKWLNEETK